MTFSELDRRYRALLQAWQSRQISEESFLDQVSELTLRDAQGQWWMIGARTGKWYVWQGGNMVEATPPDLLPPTPVPGPAAATGPGTAACPRCGEPLLPGARFCGNCGYAVPPPPPEPARCPQCGAELEPGARFCGNCGFRLTAATPSQPTATAASAQPVATGPAQATSVEAAPVRPVASAPQPVQAPPPQMPSTSSQPPDLLSTSAFAPSGLTPEAISPLEEPAVTVKSGPVTGQAPCGSLAPEPQASVSALPPEVAASAEAHLQAKVAPEELEHIAEVAAPPEAVTPPAEPEPQEPVVSAATTPPEQPTMVAGAPAAAVSISQPPTAGTEKPAQPPIASVESAPPPYAFTPLTTGAPAWSPPTPLAEQAGASLPPDRAVPPPPPTYVDLGIQREGLAPPSSAASGYGQQASLSAAPTYGIDGSLRGVTGGTPPPPPPPPTRIVPTTSGKDRGQGKGLPTWALGSLAALAALLVVGLGYFGATRLFGLGGQEQPRATVTPRIGTLAPTITRMAVLKSSPTLMLTATFPAPETVTPTLTATPEPGAPVLIVTQQVRFEQDAGAKAILDPGDVARYRISVANQGASAATSLILSVVLDDSVELVGNAKADAGTIERGNAGDDEVLVTLPRLEPGAQWSIEYHIRLGEGMVGEVTSVAVQARVTCAELSPVLSDDPDTTAANDPTVLEVVPATPTLTPVPPTASPTATATATLTPTASPTATRTTVPATSTPTSTPSATATKTAEPQTFTNALMVSNGSYGTNNVWVEHKDGIFADTPSGRYQCELGFFDGAAARSALQTAWNQAGRSGGNWRMRIIVRGSQSWVACGSKAACYDNVVEDAVQSELKAEVFMQPAVWNALAGAYASGGYSAMVANEYYDDMQDMIFKPMGASTPSTPVLAIRFTKVN